MAPHDPCVRIPDYFVPEPTAEERMAAEVKFLPGRFDILGEDGQPPIRLYRPPDVPHDEIQYTIGRSPAGPTHIQLNHRTVHRRQASLLFKDGQYLLRNHADGPYSNPTRINGDAMQRDETRVLKDGDMIEMGGVALVYRDT